MDEIYDLLLRTGQRVYLVDSDRQSQDAMLNRIAKLPKNKMTIIYHHELPMIRAEEELLGLARPPSKQQHRETQQRETRQRAQPRDRQLNPFLSINRYSLATKLMDCMRREFEEQQNFDLDSYLFLKFLKANKLLLHNKEKRSIIIFKVSNGTPSGSKLVETLLSRRLNVKIVYNEKEIDEFCR